LTGGAQKPNNGHILGRPDHLRAPTPKKKARHIGLNVNGMLIVSYYTDGVVRDALVP